MFAWLPYLIGCVLYYAIGYYCIVWYAIRTSNVRRALLLVALLHFIAGWDVYLINPTYPLFCKFWAKNEYYGACDDNLAYYDCDKFVYVWPELNKSKICPLIAERHDTKIAAMHWISINVYDQRCGKLIYESKELFQGFSRFGYIFPFFNWITGGGGVEKRCFSENELLSIDDKIKGRK